MVLLRRRDVCWERELRRVHHRLAVLCAINGFRSLLAVRRLHLDSRNGVCLRNRSGALHGDTRIHLEDVDEGDNEREDSGNPSDYAYAPDDRAKRNPTATDDRAKRWWRWRWRWSGGGDGGGGDGGGGGGGDGGGDSDGGDAGGGNGK